MISEWLADLTLELCCEITPLDRDAMRIIDRSPPVVRAAAAMIVFSKLSKEDRIVVATRVEEIEGAFVNK